ncbi:hypothetical protein PSHT_03649 [Puccinia striiformis]|uniref:Ubiquitin carboxyl-terminal hydrolase n=1 Tax=Puccinia striiformis TaxID=27350 RepID=A0A2S4WEV9_9BASI|nr:hypothetical protein PSHT_03649 [Puccinia striiformis]
MDIKPVLSLPFKTQPSSSSSSTESISKLSQQSLPKQTKKIKHSSSKNQPHRGACIHHQKSLFSHDESTIKNLITILKSLESSKDQLNLCTQFCLFCGSFSRPKVICLGCAGIFCYTSDHGDSGEDSSSGDLDSSACFLTGHATKSGKCQLGLDLICREFICLICGSLIQPEEPDLKLLTPPRGLRNLGNTCYMNVILQIILRIPELQSYFLSDHHNRLKHKTSLNEELWCCGCELVEILQLHSPSSTQNSKIGFVGNNSTTTTGLDSISPVGFLYSLWINSADGEDFAGYRESDAHECLLACLNQLHSATQVASTAAPSSTLPTLPTSTTSTSEVSGNCQCPIDLLFRCELSSQLVCGHCGITSHKIDPILDLSLEIGHLSHLEILRLEDCLDSFTKSERLKEKCYTCQNCNTASPETTKSLTISRLPHILCIQLKRFEQRGSSGSVKLDRHVKFPLLLNMKPYATTTFSPSEEGEEDTRPGSYYKLTGIVRHQGNVSSGHYQAIVYQDEQYFCFNDENVSILKLTEVLNVEAYILVYSFVLS